MHTHVYFIHCSEAYDEAQQPETEADATLRFLQDSMFHYLTMPKETSLTHMRAMVCIMSYLKHNSLFALPRHSRIIIYHTNVPQCIGLV